jgi:hypothetical protein
METLTDERGRLTDELKLTESELVRCGDESADELEQFMNQN